MNSDTSEEFKTLTNVKASSMPIKQVGIVFQDKRVPQAISFGIAVQDENRESAIQRSHSLCPSKDHTIDKNSENKNLRYTITPNLGNHISGAHNDWDRRTKISKKLINTREIVDNNQFHLTLLSSREDMRLDSDEIFAFAHNKATSNEINGKFLVRNSMDDIYNMQMANSLRHFNMEMHEYEKRSKHYLVFKNFNKESDVDVVHETLAPCFTSLTTRDELERFPTQIVEKQHKRIRAKIGLPINSSVSNSSSDEKYTPPHLRISSGKSSESVSSVDLEGWFTTADSNPSFSPEKFFY
jgi:hypothetical protein